MGRALWSIGGAMATAIGWVGWAISSAWPWYGRLVAAGLSLLAVMVPVALIDRAGRQEAGPRHCPRCGRQNAALAMTYCMACGDAGD